MLTAASGPACRVLSAECRELGPGPPLRGHGGNSGLSDPGVCVLNLLLEVIFLTSRWGFVYV